MSPARPLGLAALALACTGTPEPPPAVSQGGYVMGTVLEITAHGEDRVGVRRSVEVVFEELARLDRLLSRHEPESDVSRVNRAAGGDPVRVDPVVAELIGIAVRESAYTRGAFDVTVAPLVELWIEAARRDALPAPEDLAAARSRVGATHVRATDRGHVALDAGSAIDLGGIAKGWALDRVLPGLRRAGVEAALLSFGQSSVWALGRPPGAAGWRLLVRAPEGRFDGFVTLRDQALSVSGSLGQWSEIGGRRFGHVLDPRSGWPLTRRRQALVVAPDAATADVLSTALLVLGPEEGLAVVAARAGCEGLLLDADGGRFETPGFAAASRFQPLPPAKARREVLRSDPYGRSLLPGLLRGSAPRG